MFALLLGLLTPALVAAAQEDCDGLPPIYIDFHDRQVNFSDSHIQYGLFIGVGTPFQNQSLWPSLVRNETTFSAPDLCNGNGNPACEEQTHGTYRTETSESFQSSGFNVRDNTSIEPAEVSEMGTDTLNIYMHYFDPSLSELTQVDNFPLTQLTNYCTDDSPWYGPSGVLGLGSATPLLESLVEQGSISTRSFGLYVGTAYPRGGGAINGSLTLGGYDSGRLEGTAHSFELATDYDSTIGETPFRVTIESMILTDVSNNNSTTSLADSPFDAFITSDQFSITLPQAATETFVDLTSAEERPNTFSEPTFYLDSSAKFSLTITLTSGLTITIPPEEMRNASNASPISGPRSPNNTTDDPLPLPLLGSKFLEYVYLTANYDSLPPTFHLAPARPHGPYIMTQPLCANTIPTAAPKSKISSFSRNGIIGAVLGGVIGGIALALLGWWAFRSYRRRRVIGLYEGDGEARHTPVMHGGLPSPTSGKALAVRMMGLEKWRPQRKGRTADKGDNAAAEKGKETSLSRSTSDDDVEGEGRFDMRDYPPVAVPAAYSSSEESLSRPRQPHEQQKEQREEQSEAGDWEMLIGQAISTPGDTRMESDSPSPLLPAFSPDVHVCGTVVAGGARRSGELSPISPVSPLLPFADRHDEPADFPLPASVRTSQASMAESGRPWMTGEAQGGFEDVPLSAASTPEVELGERVMLSRGRGEVSEVQRKTLGSV